mgnify:CR=1 FL=1
MGRLAARTGAVTTAGPVFRARNGSVPVSARANGRRPPARPSARASAKLPSVPGDALAQVIITRLPFEMPTHPVLEARAERVREGGGEPFNELTLPDALVKFRQGVGRLIRTTSDRGVVAVLDSRLATKGYGSTMRKTLPPLWYTTDLATVTTSLRNLDAAASAP